MRLRAEGEGPLVVKLAGLAGGIGLFDEEIASVRRAGFHVAALDLGGDRLDDPAPGPLSWNFLAGEVFRALDELEAPRAILWGSSFGSLVALAAAARRPERILGLLLCHPPVPGGKPWLHRALLRWASRRPRPAVLVSRGFTLGFLILTAWEFVNPYALVRLPALARATREARTPHRTLNEKLGLLFGEHPGLPPHGVGCSIVAGVLDLVTPIGGARRLAGCIAGSRLRQMLVAGHSSAYARPRTYSRLCVEELRRLANGE